jgi:hypothetical protein
MQQRHQPHGSVLAGQLFVPLVSVQQNAELCDVKQTPEVQLVQVVTAKALSGRRRNRSGATIIAEPTSDARIRKPRRLDRRSSVVDA